jgi:2-furoate---CoA ligase
MDLRTIVVYTTERSPGKLALVDGDRRLTYGEWGSRVFALANALAARGIRRGDRVGLGLRNSVDHVVAFYALQVLGACAAPFNFRFKPPGVAYILDDADVSAVITDDPTLRARLDGVSERAGRILWVVAGGEGDGCESLDALVAEGDPREPAGSVSEDDLSAILYTSGTTGQPKGVPVTQRAACARMVSYIVSGGPLFESGVRTLGAAPLYHTVGMHWVLGMSIFLEGTYYPVTDLDGRALLELVERERLTFLFGSPTLFHGMLSAEGTAGLDMTSVTEVAFGSAPMPPVLLDEIGRRFPNAVVHEVYGTTEVGVPMITRDAPRAPTGALRSTVDFRARVIRPGGSPDDVVPTGEEGELIVDLANDGCFREYWRKPDKTAERVRDGWYYTGDAFHRDEHGSFYITGRLDDMFISGAENIQPVEIEQVVSAHPGVADVAVIGTPHERWGEAVTALVVRRDPELTHEEIDRHCRASELADFKRPRRVLFVDVIERNPSGKIVRKELRARYVDVAWEAELAGHGR